MAGRKESQPLPLVHPVFLDVSMLTGLIAQLASSAETSGWAPEGLEGALEVLDRWQPAEGAPVPPISSSPVIHYLATGLFGALHRHLVERGSLKVVSSAADVAGVQRGDLVEIAGNCLGNPFEDLLGFYGTVIPKILQQEATRLAVLEQLKSRARGAPKGRATTGAGTGATDSLIEEMSEGGTDELAARMILDLVDDVRRSPVRDVVLDGGDHAAVVTLSTRLTTADTVLVMRGTWVRAVGKVVKVASEDQGIDLAVRTQLGMLGSEIAADLVESAATGPYQVAPGNQVIAAPAVQLVPLALLI